ncbi:MAG TPA: alpha/beta hydrolase family protein [Pirellulaceae bacterium]|nr:alpha/beta hydrolase family protein [Pirellulaceae bacterium]
MRTALCGIIVLLLASPALAGELLPARQGTIRYEPPVGEEAIDARFRLKAHDFKYDQRPIGAATDELSLWTVTFPSPVVTPHENNNTVHCELFLPQRAEPVPGVIVLHILGGDFQLSRLFCAGLAEKGIAAMFLKMPYYGPRQQPGVKRRMISPDPRETVEGMTQAILDIRQATAFLAAQKEIDAKRLGIFGISLGGITGALATTAEPRLQNACFLLAGGDLGRVAWESKELAKVRKQWQDNGGTEEAFRNELAVIDPVRYAAGVKGKRILMLNAKSDEVIPKACTDSLWTAFGKPEIVWYDGGHYSVARHLLDALRRTSEFFAHDEVIDTKGS